MADPVDPLLFKAVMRRVPTGVTIVTSEHAGNRRGMTANAFASVSIDPPLALVCVNRSAASHDYITRAGHFCVNLLGIEQVELAQRFASRAEGDRFDGIALRTERSGAPVIDGALAFLDCELVAAHEAGSHTIFIGHVLAAGSRDGKPLGYFDGDYRDFGHEITAS